MPDHPQLKANEGEKLVISTPPFSFAKAYWKPLPKVLIAVFLAVLSKLTIGAIFQKTGHPAAALDDAYIHFQYARAIAEGHPFRFHAGEPITTGATSILWPLILAPFYAVGFRGDLLLWPAWGVSFLALGSLAFDAHAITRKLANDAAAFLAAGLVVTFGGHLWCAASGMEVVPFAALLLHAVRRAGEYADGERSNRDRARLVALAFACALMRPEGAVVALWMTLTLAVHAREGESWRKRGLVTLFAASAPITTPLMVWLLTGSPKTTTMVAKLLAENPYNDGRVAALVVANVRVLVTTLLNGEVWSAEFLPEGSMPFAFAGILALGYCAYKRRVAWLGSGLLVIAICMFAPCWYATFLWNRLRYLWPFASAWLIGLACLPYILGEITRSRWRTAITLGGGATFAALLGARLDWAIEDVAQSASGIDRQQVAMAKWAHSSLPRGVRIGVNDTGAIAYFGGHTTFDIVGLTSPDEARYWVMGPASRLEHYERLQRLSPNRLPSHFIVYPGWMQLDMLVAEPLHEAVVTDATILGGQEMVAYKADYSLLGSGENPWSDYDRVIDALDVADLESESAHGYELLGANEGEQVPFAGPAANGNSDVNKVIDGGRGQRMRDAFWLSVADGESNTLIARIACTEAAHLAIQIGDERLGEIDCEGTWREETIAIPASIRGRSRIDVLIDRGTFASFHYWVVTPKQGS